MSGITLMHSAPAYKLIRMVPVLNGRSREELRMVMSYLCEAQKGAFLVDAGVKEEALVPRAQQEAAPVRWLQRWRRRAGPYHRGAPLHRHRRQRRPLPHGLRSRLRGFATRRGFWTHQKGPFLPFLDEEAVPRVCICEIDFS